MSILAIVFAYFLGAIPFGYLLVKWRTGSDIRRSGSGNIGAANVFRTTGNLTGLLTLVLDAGKGFMAVLIAARLTGGNVHWMSAAAVTVLLGHAYSVFLRFQGGKAVASFMGAFFCLTPLPLLAALVVFAGIVAVTRYISMGSIIAAATFPLGVWLIAHPPGSVMVASIVSGALIIYRHRSNIERIRAGTEPSFSLRRSRSVTIQQRMRY